MYALFCISQITFNVNSYCGNYSHFDPRQDNNDNTCNLKIER